MIVLSACGSSDEASAPSTTAPAPSGAVEINLGEPVELPASFPAVVPIPAYLQIEGADEHVGEATTIFEVTGWFDGEPLDIASAYENTLIERGYEITSRTETDRNLFFIAESEDWYVSAGFFPDPVRNVGTSVGLTVAPG